MSLKYQTIQLKSIILTIYNLLYVTTLLGQSLIIKQETKLYPIPEIESVSMLTIPENTTVTATGMVAHPDKYNKYFRVTYIDTAGWVYYADVLFNASYYEILLKYPVLLETVEYAVEKSLGRKDSVSNSYPSKSVQLTKAGKPGLYALSGKLNGAKVNMTLDVGSSDVLISSAQSISMLQDSSLKVTEISDKQYKQTGKLAEGSFVHLREISFEGFKLFNIRAKIANNLDVPFVLNLSSLKLLGNLEFDYIKDLLTIRK